MIIDNNMITVTIAGSHLRAGRHGWAASPPGVRHLPVSQPRGPPLRVCHASGQEPQH